MAGTKVSELQEATLLEDTDLLYVVNSGSPRKSILNTLYSWLIGKGVVNSISGVTTTNGNVNLTSTEVGLGNVPNVNPVETINTLSGDVTLSAGSNITFNTIGNDINVNVDPALQIGFSNISGTWSDNTSLAVILASLGAQTAPRTINVGTGNTDLLLSDTSAIWVNADFGVDTTLQLGEIGAPEGAMIEIRQAGVGKIDVAAATGLVFITTPTGTWNITDGQGTRIQIVSLGNNQWEFK